jgi:putative two-component system response regulator
MHAQRNRAELGGIEGVQAVAGRAVEGASILVVDGQGPTRAALVGLLERNGALCVGAGSTAEARLALNRSSFDLVVTDASPSGEADLEFVRWLAVEHPDVATIMVADRGGARLASLALDLGVYGYVLKPFEPDQIVIDVVNALRRRELENENKECRRELELTVQNRTAELRQAVRDLQVAQLELCASHEETINRLSIAAELHDGETSQHIQRMSHYCQTIAELAGESSTRCEEIRLATVMHDVGKIGIPDGILLKPGRLTTGEWDVMRRHSEIGHQILRGSSNDLLDAAATVALTHHERVDGSGYPRGLSGDEIPLEGRIASIGDVFDALISDRVYREAVPLDEAVEVMRGGAGTFFDTDLLDPFLSSLDGAVGLGADRRAPVSA